MSGHINLKTEGSSEVLPATGMIADHIKQQETMGWLH